MKRIRMAAAASAVLMGVMLAGCGQKVQDEKSTQVMQITITPAPTVTQAPTPTPDASRLEQAAETTDGITMVNQYLLDQATSADGTVSAVSEDSTGDSADNTDNAEGEDE